MSLIKRGVGGKILRGPGGTISRCCCGTALTCELCPGWMSTISVDLIMPTIIYSGCIDGEYDSEIFSGTIALSLTNNSIIRTVLGVGDSACVWYSLIGRKLATIHKDGIYTYLGLHIFTGIESIGSYYGSVDIIECGSYGFAQKPMDAYSAIGYAIPISFDGIAPSNNILWQIIQLNRPDFPGQVTASDTDRPVSDWTLVVSDAWERRYEAVASGTFVLPDGWPVSPVMTWHSEWDCDCNEWGPAKSRGSAFSGDASPWTAISNGDAQITLLSYSVPGSCVLPDAICYYVWTTYYDCQSQTWSDVTLFERNLTGPESDWQNMGGMWQKITTSATAPSAPSTPPICYCDWMCDYDCATSTWGAPYMTYCYEGWGEMPWQVYGTQAYGTFTTGTTPSAPTEPGQCE